MKEAITMVKGYIDDLAHLMLSFVAIGAIAEVIFGTGIFGVNVIGNLTSIIFLSLFNNQLTGDIPQQVCDLIESNNLDMSNILTGNNLTNTCE